LLNKIIIPSILGIIVLIAGVSAFSPLNEATTVHDTVTSAISITDVFADVGTAASTNDDLITVDFVISEQSGDVIDDLVAGDFATDFIAGADPGAVTILVDAFGSGGYRLTVSYNYVISDALERCEEFEPGWEQIACSKGLFMQNIVNFHSTRIGDFDEDDPFFPCNSVESKYAPMCYHYHSWYFLLQNGFVAELSFQDCDKITPEEFVKYCYHGMGRNSSPKVFEKLNYALGLCEHGNNPQYHTDCLRGMVISVVDEKGVDTAFEFCTSIPEIYKDDCYNATGKWIFMLYTTNEEREQECSKAENSKYSDICMNVKLDEITML